MKTVKTRQEHILEMYQKIPFETLMDRKGFLSYVHSWYAQSIKSTGRRVMELDKWLSGGYKRCENKVITGELERLCMKY